MDAEVVNDSMRMSTLMTTALQLLSLGLPHLHHVGAIDLAVVIRGPSPPVPSLSRWD